MSHRPARRSRRAQLWLAYLTTLLTLAALLPPAVGPVAAAPDPAGAVLQLRVVQVPVRPIPSATASA